MTRSIRRGALAGGLAALLGGMAVAFAQQAAPARPAPPPPPAADYTDETTLPAGRRGERIRQVLDAVNSGDPARVEALVKDAFGGPFRDRPMEEHRDALLGLHDRSRGLDFQGVRRYTPPAPSTAWW